MRVPVEIAPGLSSDDTTFATGSRWADGDGVRFWQGKPQVIGGFADALNGDSLGGVCRNMLAWTNTNSATAIAFGTHLTLELYYNGALYDITPAGLTAGAIDDTAGGTPGWGSGTWGSGTWGSGASTYYARTWSLSNYGNNLIACPRGGTIYEWTGTVANPATAVTNAPATVTYALVTPQRQLLAFGCNEEISGTWNPICIRGSDIEDITDWTTTATNYAFEDVSLQGAGRIVAAAMLGPWLAVWTNTSLFIGEYVGQPDQVYIFNRVGDNCGLIGPNAFAILGQTVIWLAPDKEFRIYAVGDQPRILPCPIGKDLLDNLDKSQANKICASALSAFGEVWFHYPDSRDASGTSETSRYVAVGMQEGAGWFKGTMARTATVSSGVLQYPLKADYDGMVYYHEYGDTGAGEAMNWSIRTADIYLDSGAQAVMAREFVPDFEDQQGDVSITFHVKQYPQSTATSYGPYTIAEGDLKKDIRFNARLVALEYSGGSASGSYMRLGKPVLDVALTGRR